MVNVPFSESEVLQVVEDVVENGIIRGTKEYNKDEYLTRAESAASTPVFADWKEGGKVLYKVRLKAIDPWNFKDTSDVGTVAVRYVIQRQDDTHTIIRIDAKFVEDFRHVSHPSNGSVETSEYQDIHNRLEQLELMKAEAVQGSSRDQQSSSKPVVALKDESSPGPQPGLPAAAPAEPAPPVVPETAVSSTPPASLEEKVQELRKQVERTVKAPGAPLKAAPFHTATTLQSLPAATEVLIVISTPYWYGVETHDGQHGWMLRDDLELLP